MRQSCAELEAFQFRHAGLILGVPHDRAVAVPSASSFTFRPEQGVPGQWRDSAPKPQVSPRLGVDPLGAEAKNDQLPFPQAGSGRLGAE